MKDQEQGPAQSVVNGVSLNADLAHGPFLIDGCDTIPKLFARRCQALERTVAHRAKELGIWLAWTWGDYFEHAQLIGAGLLALGMSRGDVVSILAEDRREWVYADMAIQCAGGVASGVYTTDSAKQLSYLVNDSGSRFLFVENDEQLDKFLAVQSDMPGLEKVIVFDADGLAGFTHDRVMFLDDLYALGRERLKARPDEFMAAIDATSPDDLCLLVYTSGTTGMPKGAMLTHRNVMYAASANLVAVPRDPGDELLCFLPLCHILERSVSVYQALAAKQVVNFAESTETVFDNLREVSPHGFIAVPRVWEKIYSRIAIMASESTTLGRLAYRRAMHVALKAVDREAAGARPSLPLRMERRVWDALVFANLRRMIGLDRARYCGSGAAPISPDLLKWYRAIGIEMLEGYGMTESAGIISINRVGANRLGTVGPAVPGQSVRIAPDGEIQTRGANTFAGYWGKPDKTAETLTDDGWLRTGDIGHLDADGYLVITGRLKDIIITAGGKNITPAEIENRLKFSPYIADAVVIGDKRKFLTALVMIDQENVEKFAQDNRVPFSDFASLCRSEKVVELIGSVVEDTNREFARVEQIKDFRLIDVLLTAEDEELTATMKLKRSYVESRHKGLIDQMYSQTAKA